MINMNEFDVRRHCKTFVNLYIKEGPESAGKYGYSVLGNVDNLTEESLKMWQDEIEKEFNRQGFVLEDTDIKEIA
jgi:hypothetical protein